MKGQKIYFNPHEVMALSMGLGMIIEDFNATKMEPWNPEARKTMKEILTAARSAANKLEKFAGAKCDLPPYNEGDENEFLTKQS